jgi:NDP-sugar pyrophosphorylase family protein
MVDADSSVGPDAVVEAGAVVRGSVIWPGGRVAAGAVLNGCVVRSGQTAAGVLTGVDV